MTGQADRDIIYAMLQGMPADNICGPAMRDPADSYKIYACSMIPANI